jgi:exonuclease III
MIKLTTDKEGRYIIINGIFNGRELTLVNLYAPTQDKPKEQLDILGEIIEQVSDCIHKLIWLGDFNIHLTSLDAYKDDNFKVGKSANRLSVFMEDS